MARIVLSALVSNIRGKMAGSVIQGGSYGLIIKGNKWRCNSQYKNIGDWKIKTGNVFHLWNRLTATEKSSWKTAAAASPVTRPDGSVYRLTGYMFFTKTNLPLAFADQPLLPTPDGPAPVNYVQNVSTDSTWNSQNSFEMSMQFEQIDPANILSLDINSTAPLPVGVTPNATNFSYINTYNPAVSPIDFVSDWLNNFNEWPYNTVVWLQYVFTLAEDPGSSQILTQNITASHVPLAPPYVDLQQNVTGYISPSDFTLSCTCYRLNETFDYSVSFYMSAPVADTAPHPPGNCVFMSTFQASNSDMNFTTEWLNQFGAWTAGTVVYGYALVTPIGVGGSTETIDLLFTQ